MRILPWLHPTALPLVCTLRPQSAEGLHVQAKNILIATGGRALVPPIEGKEHTIISDQVLDLPKKPSKYVTSSWTLPACPDL